VYAIQGLVDLAGRQQGELCPSHVVAQAQGVPEQFLLQVLRPLVRARILVSVKGPSGGYRLAKRARDITLLDVIEAVEGPVRGEAPPLAHDRGTAGLEDRLQGVCGLIAEQTRRQLQKVRISDLAATS
jgi:Rrf2 family protein